MANEPFQWDLAKDAANRVKHGVGFREAVAAFSDPLAIYLSDSSHSGTELRWFCIGRTHRGIITVRFTMRGQSVRIIGAGYWRKGLKLYEEKHLHR
jgi:uncharacterized DUF497 family protein